MKNQISKNMNKKHLNIVQKLIENDEDNLDIEENSLRIASESSIKEISSESVTIF